MVDVEDGGQACHVAGNIAQTSKTRALEAMGRDCVSDLLDGVIGDLELVAVCVEENTVGLLDVVWSF